MIALRAFVSVSWLLMLWNEDLLREHLNFVLLYTQLIILLVHLSLAPAVGDHRLLIILRLLKLIIDFNLGLDLLHLIVNQVALVR